MNNFQDIKNEWQMSHCLGCEYISLEDYIRVYFSPVYNEDLDFLGWERKEAI